MSRTAATSAPRFVPWSPSSDLWFRVLTPDHHPVAVTAEGALAAATAMAVARHHAARYAVIAASDGRSLEVGLDGHTTLTPPDTDPHGWPVTVQRALRRFAPTRRSDEGEHPWPTPSKP